MSALRSRLDALRRSGGGAAADGRSTVGELRARIERLRLDGARRPGGDVARPDDHWLARRLDAEVVGPGVVCCERSVTVGARHGRTHLAARELPAALATLAASRPASPEDVVFMDTETTGLAGGTGTLAFVVGTARFRDGALRLRQHLLTRFDGEPGMLERLREDVAGATHLVTFNGRSFDAPLLATRCRLAAIDDPFAPLEHVDLLGATRRAYRGRWQNCRLATAEQQLLGYRRLDDLPGSEAPAAWFAWVRDGRDGALGRVLEHNRWDVVSLAALAVLLGEVLVDPLSFGANVAGRVALQGDEAGLYEYLRDNFERLHDEARARLAQLARRRGDWPLAVALWAQLAERDDLDAIERLAKYHEHVSRDLDQALVWTEQLLARQSGSASHQRRARRLAAKRARAG